MYLLDGMMYVLLNHVLHVYTFCFWKEKFDNSWNKAHYAEIRKAKFLVKRWWKAFTSH